MDELIRSGYLHGDPWYYGFLLVLSRHIFVHSISSPLIITAVGIYFYDRLWPSWDAKADMKARGLLNSLSTPTCRVLAVTRHVFSVSRVINIRSVMVEYSSASTHLNSLAYGQH